MSYKDLLIHVDSTRACDKRIAAAVDFASRFQAHLTGLYLVQDVVLPVASAGYLAPELYSEINTRSDQEAEAALARFGAAAEAAGVAYDRRVDHGTITEFTDLLSLHGRYADLLIMGQPEPEETRPSGPSPADVLLTSAAPVLVIPYIGAPATFGERIVVAWNASREAARAVREAMPLLERAKSVQVVTFNPRSDQREHGDLPGADIGLHLARHGIEVEVERIDDRDIDVGNALLSHLAQMGSDLLVMGGYGRSRLRELILGGATRTILQSMTVPVFMAH